MTREDYYLTMSQCSSVEFCKGYNEAIDKIFDEHEVQQTELKQIIQNQSNLLEMYSKDNEVPNNALIMKQLKAKDEENNILKDDIVYYKEQLLKLHNELKDAQKHTKPVNVLSNS